MMMDRLTGTSGMPYAINSRRVCASATLTLLVVRRSIHRALTPEVSGGEAARLNEELGACAAPCSGDCAGTPRTPPSATLAALDAWSLPQRYRSSGQVRRAENWRGLGRSTRCEKQPSKGLTLKLSRLV
jgi:hypothetical protein